MSSGKERFRWKMTSGTTWTSNTYRGFTGVITYTAGTGYALSINSGTYTSTWSTLKLAKSDYRIFLHTK